MIRATQLLATVRAVRIAFNTKLPSTRRHYAARIGLAMEQRLMDMAEMAPFKMALMGMRMRLCLAIQEMAGYAASRAGVDSHMPFAEPLDSDLHDDHEIDSDEVTYFLIESESVTLNSIERALERIEGRDYGNCQECGKAISKARLRAIPYAELCVACAHKLEDR